MNAVTQLQKLGVILARILPVKAADKMATGLGLVFCCLSKKKRDYIEKNLQHIFSNTEIEPERINFYIKRTFINSARAMVDFFRLSFISKEAFDVEDVGIDNANRALEWKKGCVLLTLHLGNWDYAGAYLAARGVPMSALVEETTPEMFELYTRHRERTGMKTFSVSRAGYAFLDAIKNNRVLAVLADRDIMKNGITVKFFSGKRNIPRGLAEIIIKKQIPVVFGYMALNPPHKKNRYVGVIEPPLVFEGGVEEFNELMVKKFETFIKRLPDQWFVFHPEWVE
jgi:KDO2-lipid IV(A) lauroyltransferase